MQLTDKKKMHNNNFPDSRREHAHFTLPLALRSNPFRGLFPGSLFNNNNNKNSPVATMLSATKIQAGRTLHNCFTIKIPTVKRQTFHFRGQVQQITERTAWSIPGLYCGTLAPLQHFQDLLLHKNTNNYCMHEAFYLQRCMCCPNWEV